MDKEMMIRSKQGIADLRHVLAAASAMFVAWCGAGTSVPVAGAAAFNLKIDSTDIKACTTFSWSDSTGAHQANGSCVVGAPPPFDVSVSECPPPDPFPIPPKNCPAARATATQFIGGNSALTASFTDDPMSFGEELTGVTFFQIDLSNPTTTPSPPFSLIFTISPGQLKLVDRTVEGLGIGLGGREPAQSASFDFRITSERNPPLSNPDLERWIWSPFLWGGRAASRVVTQSGIDPQQLGHPVTHFSTSPDGSEFVLDIDEFTQTLGFGSVPPGGSVRVTYTINARVFGNGLTGGGGVSGASMFGGDPIRLASNDPSATGSFFRIVAGGEQIFPLEQFVAAVLPSSRSVKLGTTATAFATVINSGTGPASRVGLAPKRAIPATFKYNQTNCATNAVIGADNVPVDIAAGDKACYVISITPTAPFNPTDIAFAYGSGAAAPGPTITGVNTLLMSASATPVSDVIALAATIANDGIVNVPGTNGTGVFAVATTNLGLGGPITVSADTGTAVLPLTVQICQTNPLTGVCLSTLGPTATAQIDSGATPTFAFFVTATGPITFDPAVKRIFVRFKDGPTIRGATSVAVRTL